jgi:hypothetical protein
MNSFQAVSPVIVIREKHRSIKAPDDSWRHPRRCASAVHPPHGPRRQCPIEEDDESDFERSDAVQDEQHADLEDDEEVGLC